MPELALCEDALAIVLEASSGRDIDRVKVRVGQLRRVLPESWEMCWQKATNPGLAQVAKEV